MKRRTRPGRPNRFLEAHRPATASDFLFHLPEYIADHGRRHVVLCGRVSSFEQYSHLADIIAFLESECRAYPLKVVGKVRKVVPGSWPFDYRRDLREASRIAREHGAFILCESACRVIRSPAFHPSLRPDALPTTADFAKLMRDVGVDVDLVTALHPDLTPAEVRRHESTVRAGFAKRKPSETREALLDRVREMRAAQVPKRAIARALKLSESTLRGRAWR